MWCALIEFSSSVMFVCGPNHRHFWTVSLTLVD